MESINERNLYDNVAYNVRNNIESINELLGNCSVQSKVATQEQQIVDFRSLNAETLLRDEPKDDYYDLSTISKIFDMLEPSKLEGKKKLKSVRSESTFSLLSATSNQSVDDFSQPDDYINEVTRNLTDIRTTLEQIQNSSIQCPDLNAIRNKETAKNVKFCDLVMSLRKFAKELNNIALSDQLVDDHQKMPVINNKLLSDLDQLCQVCSQLSFKLLVVYLIDKFLDAVRCP